MHLAFWKQFLPETYSMHFRTAQRFRHVQPANVLNRNRTPHFKDSDLAMAAFKCPSALAHFRLAFSHLHLISEPIYVHRVCTSVYSHDFNRLREKWENSNHICFFFQILARLYNSKMINFCQKYSSGWRYYFWLGWFSLKTKQEIPATKIDIIIINWNFDPLLKRRASFVECASIQKIS